MDTVSLLLSSFVLSITGLFVFIWSLRKRLLDAAPEAANIIFFDGEIGRGDLLDDQVHTGMGLVAASVAVVLLWGCRRPGRSSLR